MSFDRIVGQDRAKALVGAWLKTRRVPHAILLSGPAGTGKRRLALELAKALNCQGTDGSPCDRCISCRKIETLSHPDVHVLLPLASRRDKPDSASVPGDVRAAVQDYLQKEFSLARSNVNIARDYIRALQKEIAYTPVEAPYKIGLIFEAECMHPAGANSLLKTLEEPPADAVFILVSTNPQRLLSTILSRCQRVPLQRLGQAELKAHLQGLGVGAERLELAVRMGVGSLQRATQVATGEFDETRTRVETFLLAGLRREDEPYWSLLDEMGGKAARRQLEDFLEVCGQYVRDLWLLAYGGEDKMVHVDRLDFLQQARAFFQVEQIEMVAAEVDRAVENLSRNVNVNLLLTDLWRWLRRCANQESASVPDRNIKP